MKKYILILTMLFVLSSCNDDYLEKLPLNEQTEETAFVTAANFETYAWGLYGQFMYNSDYVRGYSQYHTNYLGDYYAGYLGTYGTSESNYRSGNIIPPTTGNGWTFTFVRKVNMMLEHIETSEMSDADKAHWRAVGLFFHSFKYYELVSRFGDVPWITTVIGDEDTDLIYGKRDPRTEVTDKILANLQEAEQSIYEDGNGSNTINRDCVRALMSRFCLFEGTWRKYHGLGDYDKYLTEAIRVSEALMADYPNISDDFDAILNSADLSTHPGMILHYIFETGIIGGYASRFERTTSGIYEMPKYSIERYLCTDGKPITSSELYEGDETMYEEFRNRDNRLLLTIVPPYSWKQQCIGGLNPPSFEVLPTATYNTVGHFIGTNSDGSAIDVENEYVDKMKVILPDDTKKRIPVFNWSGTMNWFSPNITGTALGPMSSRSGYFVWKYYNLYDDNNYGSNFTDKPLFWIDEVMMNYAEAKFEVGQFNQDVADKTINRFRARAGVADMVVADITDSFDVERDTDVDPVLWEIRRERFAEFIGHGFGWEDIRRWKKGPEHINRTMIGTYVDIDQWKKVNTDGTISDVTPAAWSALSLVDKDFKATTGKGYLKRFDNPANTGAGWNDKYYLYAIPTDELVLNPNLEQNLGW